MKDYSRLKEHCYQTLKLPISPKTKAEHLMVLELIEYYEEQESVFDKIRTEIKEWYWQADKQALAKDPCVVDAMVDLFIRTIDKYKAESEE